MFASSWKTGIDYDDIIIFGKSEEKWKLEAKIFLFDNFSKMSVVNSFLEFITCEIKSELSLGIGSWTV